MDAKHTSGPWRWFPLPSRKTDGWLLANEDGGKVALVEPTTGTALKVADRRLIVAAPDLLAACEAALDPDPCQFDHHGYCQAHSLQSPCEQALLRSAIAKAKGEAAS